MLRTRSITSLLAAPMWALNVERGSRLFTQSALEMKMGPQRPSMMEDDEVDSRTPEERANYWRDFLKSTGIFPYYINPDGAAVHSLDPDYKEKLRAGAVAVIPVFGTIVREAWVGEEVWWGLVSSKRVAEFLRDIKNEPKVVGAVMDIYSPGGMVDGTEALGRAMRELTAVKKTEAHVDSMAASAAYWLASQCGTIRLDGQTTEVGSVGVMLSFFDVIPFYESMGVKYHELYAPESDKKNEAWRQLREQKDPEKFKGELSQVALVFQGIVKEGRGKRLGTTDLAAIEGRMFAGNDAIAAGLADSIGDLADSIATVRPATRTNEAPPSQNPLSPDPANDPANNAAGTATPKTSDTQTPTMKFADRLIALIAALFSTKEDATAENIAEANAKITEQGITGVAIVSTEEQARVAGAAAELATAANQVNEANTARTEAVTARDAAITAQQAAEGVNAATIGTLTALATANEVAIAEGQTPLEAICAALTARTASLAAANARITELEGEEAPTGAEGAINEKGDINDNDEKLTDEQKAFRAETAQQVKATKP